MFINDIVTDKYDLNVYLCGQYSGAVDFDDSQEVDQHIFPHNYGYGAFVTKIADNGTYDWTKTFYSTRSHQNVKANGIGFREGRIVVVGEFNSQPGFASVNFYAAYGEDLRTSAAEYGYHGFLLNMSR